MCPRDSFSHDEWSRFPTRQSAHSGSGVEPLVSKHAAAVFLSSLRGAKEKRHPRMRMPFKSLRRIRLQL
jgi:hypothetical protein